MSAEHTEADATPHGTNETAARPTQDVREDAHDDSRSVTQNNPPNHGGPTTFPGTFLWWVGKTGRIKEIDDLDDELAGHLEDWKRLNETEQAELGGYK